MKQPIFQKRFSRFFL